MVSRLQSGFFIKLLDKLESLAPLLSHFSHGRFGTFSSDEGEILDLTKIAGKPFHWRFEPAGKINREQGIAIFILMIVQY